MFGLVLLVNYALAPGHAVTSTEMLGFFFPLEGSPSLSVWLRTTASRGGAALVWLIANAAILGAGLAAARWLGAGKSILRAWLIGIAPLGLALLGLGLAGLWTRPALAVLAAGPAVGALLAIRGRVSSFKSQVPSQREEPWASRHGLLLAVAPCLLALPAALAPEISFDAMRYHLALPDLYLKEHRIFQVERFLFAGFPATVEMIYGLALAFGTTVSAKLFAWECFVFAAAQLFLVLRRRLPKSTAVLLVAGFAAMPFLSSHSGFAGVDHPVMCLEMAAFAIVLEQLAGPLRKREWVAAGWLFGSALGTKYLGAFALLGAGAALAAVAPRTAAARRFVTHALPVAAAVPAAWWLKNWLLAGNPVYPYLFGHFQIDAETFRLHLLWAEEWKRDYSWLAGWLKVVPLSLSRGTYDSVGEALAPHLFLTFGLAAAARGRLPRPERWLLALTAVLLVVWARAGGGIYRYLAPLYPAATLLAGLLLARAAVPRRCANAFLAVSLAIQLPPLLAAHYRQADPSGLMAGVEGEREYVDRIASPPGRYLVAINRGCAAAATGRLYMLGDPKTFYAPRRSLTEFELAPPLLHDLAAASPTPHRMRVRFRQRRITAVLYRVEGMISMIEMSKAALTGAALARLQDFWRDYAQPLWAADHPAENSFYQCFRLRSEPGPFTPPASELRYILPAMEAPTQEIDRLLDAGRFADALRNAAALVEREPGFAPGWFRLWVAARKNGDRKSESRAAARVRELGFGSLLRS